MMHSPIHIYTKNNNSMTSSPAAPAASFISFLFESWFMILPALFSQWNLTNPSPDLYRAIQMKCGFNL